jgi:CheY-like chemotaxis protein
MKKKKLLLVDDVELFLQLGRSFLKRSSFDIHVARNGEQALAKARDIQPDLVLLDLHMPDMDGDAICRIIKGDPDISKSIVIMISSGRRDEDRGRMMSCGCEAVILKPVSKEDLCRVVETQLGISQRLYRRVDTNLQCQIEHRSHTSDSSIHCIGQGGAFVEVPKCNPAVGDRAEMRFALPNWRRSIQAAVQVCWTGIKGEGGPMGAGLKFLEIDADDQMAVGRFVDSELALRGPVFIPAEGTVA